jgi:hypothetical protein
MSGINFYVVVNQCPACHHGIEIHVGKTAGTRKFCFEKADIDGVARLSTKKEWIEFMRTSKLAISGTDTNNDETKEYTLDEFLQIVDGSQSKRSHLVNHDNIPADVWELVRKNYYIDPEGYEFSTSSFS